MADIYNVGLVTKEIARCIGDFFDKASMNLPYSKGYKGKVTSGSDGSYSVLVNGVENQVKTDLPLSTGEYVTLLSLQNQKGDFAILPAIATSDEVDEMLNEVLS